MAHLPTVAEVLGRTLDQLNHARNALSEAASWLRSDGRPSNAILTDDQADARTATFDEIATAKAAIDRATNALYEALR